MLREPIKRAVASLGRSTVGKHVVHAATASDRGNGRFRDARWPVSAACFEDLDFLFTSSQLNHGIVSLRLDEAAFLFRLVRSLDGARVVELGRFKGGSTFLLAVAMTPGSELWSYDLHVDVPRAPPARSSIPCRDGLARYGLENVHLIVANTRTAQPPYDQLDLLFVDADHRYEGARADFDTWGSLVRPGGHILFHDGVDVGGYGTAYSGVRRLMEEIDAAGEPFRRVEGAGSIAHFVRQREAAST